MTHNEKRGDWKKEALMTTVSGCFFGGTNTIVGQPLDTVKTRMQTQCEIMSKNNKLMHFIGEMWSKEGLSSFYKGWGPNFCGSVLYRSAQFAAFEAAFTKWKDNQTMMAKIPLAGGLEVRVVAAGIISGTVRSLMECPFEYAKVKR